MLNIAVLLAAPRPPSRPWKMGILGTRQPRGTRSRHPTGQRPGAVGLWEPPASVSAQFESTTGAMFVIRHQAARGLAFICAVVLAGNPGPPLIRHVRSTITQRGLVNSLLQLGELNAITVCVSWTRRAKPLICHPDGCYKVKTRDMHFPVTTCCQLLF